MRKSTLGTIIIGTTLGVQSQAVLIAYWNFNDLPSSVAGPYFYGDSRVNPSAYISTDGWEGGLGRFNNQNTTENALFDDAGSFSISFGGEEGNGSYIDFVFSSSGYEDLEISFKSFRTGGAYTTSNWLWSTDGSTFTNFIEDQSIPGSNNFNSPVQHIELPDQVNDSDSVIIRYVLSGGSGNVNYRLDNIQINGAPALIPEPSVLSLLGVGLLSLRRRRRQQ